MRNTILQGDALAMLATLPDNYVQTCITSPPYYGLRDYGIDGQIGLENTPEAYMAKLVEVFREVRRVLRPDGTLWVNIGDSYAGGNRGGQSAEMLSKNWHPTYPPGNVPSGYKPKDLLMIPAQLALALRADGWYLRSDIIWHKPNCMPESVEDRPTTAHEHIFLLAKNERYYYDADAIAEYAGHAGKIVSLGEKSFGKRQADGAGITPSGNGLADTFTVGNTRNKRSVWAIPTMPYSAAHFATFPPKLIEPCILAGSRPGDVVLDPFMGAGTVALVSIRHGRDWLGVELNPEYIKLAEKRIAYVQQNLWSIEDIAV